MRVAAFLPFLCAMMACVPPGGGGAEPNDLGAAAEAGSRDGDAADASRPPAAGPAGDAGLDGATGRDAQRGGDAMTDSMASDDLGIPDSTVAAGIRGVANLQGEAEHGATQVSAEGTPFVTETAPDGSWRMEIPPGRYTLRLEHEGYETVVVPGAEVGPGEEVDLGVIELRRAAPPSGTLEGVATRLGSADHAGIGVELLGTPLLTLTAADGRWALEARPGRYALRFTAPGHEPAEIDGVELGPGQRVRVDPVVLRGLPGSVVGRVALPAGFDARLLARVVVELTSVEDGALVAAGAPDAEGRFAFDLLPAGSYLVEARLEGFETVSRAAEVDAGVEVDVGLLFLDPAAPPPGRLHGVARLVGAAEHAGIRVDAIDTPFATLTDAAGRWQLELPSGDYGLRFTAEGYLTELVGPLRIRDGEVLEVREVVLPLIPGDIVGRVTTAPFDDLVDSVALVLQPIDGDRPLSVGNPRRDGSFVFEDVPPGVYTVEASLFEAVMVVAEVQSGARTDVGQLEVRLEASPLAGFEGIASRSDSDDRAGIRVSAVGTRFETTTRDNGAWTLAAPPWSYTLRFEAEGYAPVERANLEVIDNLRLVFVEEVVLVPAE